MKVVLTGRDIESILRKEFKNIGFNITDIEFHGLREVELELDGDEQIESVVSDYAKMVIDSINNYGKENSEEPKLKFCKGDRVRILVSPFKSRVGKVDTITGYKEGLGYSLFNHMGYYKEFQLEKEEEELW